MKLWNIYHSHLFPSAKNAPSSRSWKSFHLLHWGIHHYCWFALVPYIFHAYFRLDVIELYHLFLNSNFIVSWIKQVFNGTTIPLESRTQSLYLFHNLRQIVLSPLMMVYSLFFFRQNNFGFLELHRFVSTDPIVVDVSHLEGLISTSTYQYQSLTFFDAFQQMLYVVCES